MYKYSNTYVHVYISYTYIQLHTYTYIPVPLCTAAFSFFFSSYDFLLLICPFRLNRHLLLLGPATHSLRACLSLRQSSNCVHSLSIAFDIRLYLLILRPLISKLLFPRMPHSNLGEPNTMHSLRSLYI